MNNLLDGIEEVLLMGPGPSYIHDSVYEALRQKTLGHLDPYFLKIMDAIKGQLQELLNTKNALTFPMSRQAFQLNQCGRIEMNQEWGVSS